MNDTKQKQIESVLKQIKSEFINRFKHYIKGEKSWKKIKVKE